MLKWIKGYLARRRTKAAALAHLDGYMYAAGMLLRATHKQSMIDELDAMANNPFEPGHAFDRGVAHAIIDWESQFTPSCDDVFIPSEALNLGYINDRRTE